MDSKKFREISYLLLIARDIGSLKKGLYPLLFLLAAILSTALPSVLLAALLIL